MAGEIEDHIYSPDYQAMGDCRVCGHDQEKPWHLFTDAWHEAQTYSAPHTDIALGKGEWIIGHAIYKGTPAIIFTPAVTPGAPGDDASNQIAPNRIAEGAIVLRFLTGEAAISHLDRLKMMAEQFAAAVARNTTKETTK